MLYIWKRCTLILLPYGSVLCTTMPFYDLILWTPIPLHCLWQIFPTLLPLVPFLSHTSPLIILPLFVSLSLSLSCSYFLSLASLPLSLLFSLGVSLPGVVSVAGVLLFLTATALTSMTFFSCLVRHQTPALREATLLHRRRAAAKLCTGTAWQWSWSGRRWEEERGRGAARRKRKENAELGRKDSSCDTEFSISFENSFWPHRVQ